MIQSMIQNWLVWVGGAFLYIILPLLLLAGLMLCCGPRIIIWYRKQLADGMPDVAWWTGPEEEEYGRGVSFGDDKIEKRVRGAILLGYCLLSVWFLLIVLSLWPNSMLKIDHYFRLFAYHLFPYLIALPIVATLFKRNSRGAVVLVDDAMRAKTWTRFVLKWVASCIFILTYFIMLVVSMIIIERRL